MSANLIDKLMSKQLHRWIGGYSLHLARQLVEPRSAGQRHLLFALCDHYEPLWPGNTQDDLGERRVQAWLDQYPRMAQSFRDADGRPPRHSFFFPGEQYRPKYLELLARLVRAGYGEVEFHLHHDGDTADQLRTDISSYLERFAEHGHLSRDALGRLRYAFIHGNWSLANARSDRKWCGVDAELPLLFETGCYADFTFPSAPDECQPTIVNHPRAYEWGERARVGQNRSDRILMIQGPLALCRRAGSLRVRIENSALTAQDPATPSRIRTWITQNVIVEGRPDWVFVKVHTHGAPERQAASLLADGGRMLHRELTSQYNDGEHWLLHYVTAREMFNIAMAAMDGHGGNPNAFRDYCLKPPPVVS
jgi:hypothetical protein